METSQEHLDIVVDSEVLLAARKVADAKGTSKDQLVRDFLGELAYEKLQRQRAAATLKELMKKKIVEVGEITWSRDDLYKRR